MAGFEEADLSRCSTYSIHSRKSKVAAASLGRPVGAGSSFAEFWDSLPDQLAAADLKKLVACTAEAVSRGKPVLLMMGAHVIKTGLTPVLIDLLRSGAITGLAMNGAGAIHDSELACFGMTSEDVAVSLADGSFGMAEETAALVNGAAADAAGTGKGLGEALGEKLRSECGKGADLSLLAACSRMEIPATVHVALGTDIVHQHASADGAAIGETSLRDFRRWARLVAELNDGGVLLHVGSSVLLPEVFLKSLTVARNIYGPVENFTTANFDMIRHYRSSVNVVERPTRLSGTGYNITGHHELMIPLFAAALAEAMK